MIYLDNAATTFPKPTSVSDEVYKCMTAYCGNPGRSGHSLSLSAAKKIFDCRALAADLFGAYDTDRIIFTPNTTYSLNMAIKGLLRKGDHVIISDMEHNAVWRPIHKMANEGKIEYDVFKTFVGSHKRSDALICASIARLIRPNTRMVICAHTSNVCPVTLPIREIGALCRKNGILFVVDGAQSAGHLEINAQQMNVDALCLPGHKGLYGPQGSGMLILGKDISPDTLTEGGNGIDSLSPEMSAGSPERYEAGTVSTPCIAGLWAGLKYVTERGISAIAQAEAALQKRAVYMLRNTSGISVYLPEHTGSTVLFNVDGVPSEKVATLLDTHGICVRGGYHCAPLAHKTLGTPDGGAVRVSLGAFNRMSDIEVLYKAITHIS